MLARIFHAWEHRLASVTKDRVVRPFEWGLDWIPPDNHDRGPLNDGDRVARWVRGAMDDSDQFFTLGSARDYSFTEADPTTQPHGEHGTLRFPSAISTRHPENNVVVARWFRASGEPPHSLHSRRQRGRAVLVLPQWNSDAGGHIGLSKLLARCGISTLRLSLPYHDARMPPELTRADFIVSANVARTLQVCRQAVLDARGAIAWLAERGYERIGIVGTSLGSCLAMLTAAHEPLIRVQALNHVSPWFADVVWRGLSTRHVRDGLEGHIDLDRLRELWSPLSPWSYLDRVRNKRTLLVYARYDLTFPVDLSRMLIEEFRRREIPHEVAVLPCGHYTSGTAPFKYLDGYLLARFLLRNL